MSGQVVDPQVSQAKFAAEVASFRKLETMHRKRGWWLMSAEFPTVQIGFITPNCRPATLALCALIDFTNYDLWAPSVRFVQPFTAAPLTAEQIGIPFLRMTPEGLQPLLQEHPGQRPFLCIPGVREYHDHPAHSADAWLLRRGKGEGGLMFIVDKISTYGSEPMTVWQMEMRPKLAQSGAPL